MPPTPAPDDVVPAPVPAALRAGLCAVLLAAALVAPPGAAAQDRDAPPSFSEVVGHEIGQRITRHHEMVDWLEALAAASDRVSLIEQGRSWEGRRLPAAVVTSPANHGRLAEIRRTNAELSDPRGLSPEEARDRMEGQPVVVWYGGSIHGNELSGSEGLLKLLERLATADDPATRGVLERAVVLIDPMLNPDGREAFARANVETRGRLQNPDPDDWNNDFDFWHGVKFRTGHYFFDTNRDWFAHTQRETRARAPTLRRWNPQVAVDAHEMGRGAEFFFDPATGPYPDLFPPYAREGFELFNDAYAAAFDSAGFEYMTRERYNYFYPGYTTSWSSYQNAVGMLYEQGSSAGLAVERPDGSVRGYDEAVAHQYVAAWTAARTAADRRGELLRDWHAGIRRSVEAGREGPRRYLLPPGGDPAHRAEAVRLLRRNGIEVGRLGESVELDGVRDREGRDVGGRRFPAGTWVVEAAQPRGRLARVLLEPSVAVPDSFLRRARERVEKDQSPRFYDITAWSLPLLFDLPGFSSRDGRDLPTEPLGTEDEVRRPEVPAADAGYAYLLDGGTAATASVLWHLADRGHRARMLLDPTEVGGTAADGGAGVVFVGLNDGEVHDDVRELARRFAVDVRAVDTGLAAGDRPSLGTDDAVPVRVGAPRVALLAGPPVHGYSFGWSWHALDRQYEIPHAVLRTRSLSGEALAGRDVLVIPHVFSASALADRLGEAAVERLGSWVREGGTLVTVGGAVDFAREQLGLLSLRSWYEEAGGGDDAGEDAAGDEPYRFEVPGAFFAASVDDAWWMAAGVGDGLPVLVDSDRVYLPPAGPPDADRRVVARYADEGPVPVSGHAWAESAERLPGAVFAYEERVGDGRVVAFAEDPSFRGFWRGPDRLLLNAVVFGPTAP